MLKKLFCSSAVFLLVLCVAAGNVTVDFKINNAKPFYNVGDKIIITANVLEDGNPAAGKNIRCNFTCNAKTLKYIRKADAGKPFVFEHTAKEPGFVSVRFYLVDENGKTIKQQVKRGSRTVTLDSCGGYGVMISPEKLAPSVEEPADFDEFWNGIKAELAKVPVKEIERKHIPNKRADVYDVKISCIGDKPVSGYLCIQKNAKPKSLPAIVYYHAAGVRSSYICAGHNAILFNVNAHGILNGQSKEYYEKMRFGALKNYPRIGKESRDTIYFRGMFLRMLRSLDYVKSRPEWNGKVLVVTGGSMGGGQSIAAAALDPQVTLVVAGVPAIGDHGGNLAKIPRRPGWPQFYYAKTAAPEVTKATSYYDNIFFARRVKCEVFLTTGLIDRTCPPTSVYLYYMNLKSAKKDLDVFPCGEHNGCPTTKGYKRLREVIAGK